MNRSTEQEQITRLKKSNERLTILCIVLAVIAIGAGLYARIQHAMAREQSQLALVNAERAMDQAKKTQALSLEAVHQRAIAERLKEELDALKEKSKKAK